MQTLVIGDIHGCYDELQSLLDKAGLTDEDAIVSVGDCVDRGPGTPAVLRFFQEKPNAKLIMGNHERKHEVLQHGLSRDPVFQGQVFYPGFELHCFSHRRISRYSLTMV